MSWSVGVVTVVAALLGTFCVVVWAARLPQTSPATPARRPADSLDGRGEWQSWWCTECGTAVHATSADARDRVACHHLTLHRESSLA